MPDTLRVVAHFIAQAGMGAQLKAVLAGLVEPTRNETGCISYQLFEDVDVKGAFTFIEEWKSNADLDAHFETPHVQAALAQAPGLLAEDMDLRKYNLVG